MTRVKVCGVVRPDDAALATLRGADYLGLNFWPGSPRRLEPARARVIAEVARRARADVQVVGVFVDAPPAELLDVAGQVGLDVIQLHGDEPPATVEAVVAAGLTAWKAVAVRGPDDVAGLDRWPAQAYVLDAASPGRGGSGKVIDWSLARVAVDAGHPVVLAGGLTATNVASAIAGVAPFAVDVCSGIERSPGDKDPVKLIQFLDAVRRMVSYLPPRS